MHVSSNVLRLCLGCPLALVLAGCADSTTFAPATGGASPDAGLAIRGRVYGGQQPIAGANVYLYAANTTGYGNASVSLLSAPGYVTTSASGTFAITGEYTCPSAAAQVYVYSVGGNPGAGGTNAAAGLLAGLGNCGSLTSSTFIMVNEVSTIATAYAIAGYATDAKHVSSSSSTLGLAGIANAFAAIQNLETLGTGVALAATPGANGTVPQSEIDTLANILASCINSPAPSSTGCATLLSNATNAIGTEPTDTATAAINIAHNPGANLATLYGLATASAPFQPALTSQPNDFTIAITYTGGGLSNPYGLAIDASGNVWTANLSNNTLSEFNPSGVAQSGSGFTGGGLNDPRQLAVDTSGNVWITNLGGNVLSEFDSSGAPVSATGHTGALNDAYGVAIDGSGNVWVANDNASSLGEFNFAGVTQTGIGGFTGGGLDEPYGVAVDTSNHIWAGNYHSVLSEFMNNGSPISSSGYTGGGLDASLGIAVDGSGNVWTTNENNNSLSMFNSSGVAQSGSGGFTGGGLNTPVAIAIDGSGNVWASNIDGNSISEFSSLGAAISGASGYDGGGLSSPIGIAIDGSGNVWVTDSVEAGASITELVGAATPVVTPIQANLKSPYGSHAVNKP